MHTGQAYINTSGKKIPARNLKPLKNCRNKCIIKLNEEDRKNIFKEYWSLGTHDRRVTFIAKLITTKNTTRIRRRISESRRNRDITIDYWFEVRGERIQVCKDCFLKTLDEKEKFVKYVLINKSRTTSGIIENDRRGKNPSINKTSGLRIQAVIDHINSFPSYVSHYTRRTNDKKYLPPFLNLQKMYRLYTDTTDHPVSRTIYEREFHKLNLRFKKPHVDTCHKCDILQMEMKIATENNNEAKRLNSEATLTIHQEMAEKAYECKKRDKEAAKIDGKENVFLFRFATMPAYTNGSLICFVLQTTIVDIQLNCA